MAPKIIFYATVFLLLFLPMYLSSTCIIIYRSKNTIIIGADSKERGQFINKRTGEIISSSINKICKIHNVGKYYFAISGIDDGLLLKNATIACKYSSLQEIANQFAEKMRIEYPPALRLLMRANKTQYLERYVKNKNDWKLGRVAFFGFENNYPVVLYVDLDPINKIDTPVDIKYKITALSDIEPIAFLGLTNDIDKLPSNYDAFSNGIIEGIKLLIETEIKGNDSVHVGGPINLMQLNRNGVQWYGPHECSF